MSHYKLVKKKMKIHHAKNISVTATPPPQTSRESDTFLHLPRKCVLHPVPLPEVVSTWRCVGGMSQDAGMSWSWGWCSLGQLCSAPALTPRAMGLCTPSQQLWVAEPAQRWAATALHGLRSSWVAMESRPAGSQTLST